MTKSVDFKKNRMNNNFFHLIRIILKLIKRLMKNSLRIKEKSYKDKRKRERPTLFLLQRVFSASLLFLQRVLRVITRAGVPGQIPGPLLLRGSIRLCRGGDRGGPPHPGLGGGVQVADGVGGQPRLHLDEVLSPVEGGGHLLEVAGLLLEAGFTRGWGRRRHRGARFSFRAGHCFLVFYLLD